MLLSTRLPIFFLAATLALSVRAGSIGGEDLRSLSRDEVRSAQEAGYSYVDRLTQLEEDLYAQGFHVKEGSPMSMMAKFKRPSKEVIALSRSNMRFVETVRYLKNDLGLKEEEIEGVLADRELDTGCLPNPGSCGNSRKYRTIDGTCNHVENNLRNLGRSVSGFRRLLKPIYDDGISSPRRRGIAGADLPNSRAVSMIVFSGKDKPHGQVTSLLMQFGQFIIHDMASTSQFSFPNGEGFSCCGPNNTQLDPSVLNSLVHCLPITIPIGDRTFNNSQNGCMNFVRSSTGPNRISCNLPLVSYAEQLNQNTHWLDASVIYGSNMNTVNSLRNASNGLLKTSIDSNGHSLLPMNTSCTGCLFSAGDSRVTEQPQLTVIQTIWMREHNRIAKNLSSLNPTWSRETVFQETRRIVIAELQHITYNEFLPTLLGVVGMQKYNLLRPLRGKKTFKVSENDDDDDDKNSDESKEDESSESSHEVKRKITTSGPISNEFATAAFRMGHSLVQGKVQLVDVNGQVTNYNLRSVFNIPDLTSNPQFLDNTIRGLVTQPSQTIDTQVTGDLWLRLFETPQTTPTGQPSLGVLDLVALNIQRGRDHGLPGYNSYRQLCGLPKLVGPIANLPTQKPNDTISPYFDPIIVSALSSVYNSVDDIDLFVGGLSEMNQQDDGLLGPTFSCIIAENFLKVKYEDRYFYEAGPGTNPNPFTADQLVEIKKASMARLFCDNDDGSVSGLQPNVFLISSADKNPIVQCNGDGRIPSLNLNLWKSRRPNDD